MDKKGNEGQRKIGSPPFEWGTLPEIIWQRLATFFKNLNIEKSVS
jgi:hypothetical protein